MGTVRTIKARGLDCGGVGLLAPCAMGEEAGEIRDVLGEGLRPGKLERFPVEVQGWW